MEIISIKAYKLDHGTSTVFDYVIPEEENDFTTYLRELLFDVISDKRSKEFHFHKSPSGIKTTIATILDSQYETAFRQSSERLLKKEIEAQSAIEHLEKEIQKGMIIQSFVNHENQYIYVIIKAEEFEFINEISKTKDKGFPLKKKVFKSFCAYLDSSKNLLNAYVGDSNSNISSYWWKDFLELEQVHDDTHNSKKCIEALDKKIFKRIKDNYPADHTNLRNTAIHYLRTKTEFVIEDFANGVFKEYQPVDESINIGKLYNEVLILPKNNNFDERFKIDSDSVKVRMSNKINLTEALVLEIKHDIDFDGIVIPKMIHSVKYLQIKTEAGYEHFKKREVNSND